MTRRPVIGGDPGHDAGAVVVLDADGCTIRAAMAWKRRRRKGGDVWAFDVRIAGLAHAGEHGLDWVLYVVEGNVKDALRGGGWYDVVVEEVEGHRMGRKSLLTMGEARGRLVQALGGAEGVKASEWRPAMLGSLPSRYVRTHGAKGQRLSRVVEDWGAYASHAAKQAFRGEVGLLDNEHVAEAAWIARWGWAQQGRTT